MDDIEISKLDYEFISEYEWWIKSVWKCSYNSTIKYLTNFRKVINRCVRHGWLVKDPFANFKMTLREVQRIALTETELQTLVAQQFPTDRLRLVRDIFLFSCCYTGLAYADVKKLKRSEIIIGVDNEQWHLQIVSKIGLSSTTPEMEASECIYSQPNILVSSFIVFVNFVAKHWCESYKACFLLFIKLVHY